MSEHDGFTNPGPVPTTAEEANQQRQARHEMVENARQIGEAQKRTPVLPAQRDMSYAALAPEGHPDPKGYITAMIARGGANRNAPVLDSSKIGPLPVDANILSNCRSPAGFTCSPANLKAGSTVFYTPPGGGKPMEIEVEQAVRQGLLVRDLQRGGYAVPGPELAQARDDAAKQADEQAKAQAASELESKRASGDECDAETQGALDIVSKHVPAEAASALVNDFVSNGNLSEGNVVAIAEKLGWTGDQGKAVAVKVIDGIRRQADAIVTSSGIAAHATDDVWVWLADKYPSEHKNAIIALAHGNQTAPMRALIKKYKALR